MTNFIYETLALFFIYSFLGWCVEVIYATCKNGGFVNRGFLNGPVCPIYGFGVTLVIACLSKLSDNLIILFIGAFLLTTFLEFITGFILERIFNDKWWDYSDNRFNIKGYVCLRFSIIWGVACILVVKGVQPLIKRIIYVVPIKFGIVLLSIALITSLIDFIITVISISKFKKKLYLMDQVACKLRFISDEIGESISEGVLIAIEKQEEVKESAESVKDKVASKVDIEKHKKELEELKDKYKTVFEKKSVGYERFFKAFPDLQKGKYKEYIDKIRSFYKK